MATLNWRTINIDALDPDSPANFDLSTLTPAVAPISTADVQSLAGQIRQLLRGGDNEGALQGALENPPYGADERGKVRRDIKLPHITSTSTRRSTVPTPAHDSGTPSSSVSPHLASSWPPSRPSRRIRASSDPDNALAQSHKHTGGEGRADWFHCSIGRPPGHHY